MSAGWMDKFLYRLSRKGEIPWLTLSRGKVSGNVTVLIIDPDGNRILSRGTSVPSAAAGYAKGALFLKTDAGNGVQALYENIGTTASCSFSLVGSIVPAEIALPEGNMLVGNNVGAAVALVAKTNGAILIGNGTTVVSAVMSTDATIAASGALTIANNAVTNAKLAAMAVGTVKIGGAGNVATDLALPGGSVLSGGIGSNPPVALSLAINQSIRLNVAGTGLEAFTIARKDILTGTATGLGTLTVAAGDLVTANATDLAVVTVAAGSVVVGGTGPAIASVALATGQILKGVTGATPMAQSLTAKQLLYYNSVASDLTGLTIATGDIVTANATDVATLTLAVNEVVYKTAAGALAGLAVARKTLVTGGATQLQAVTIGNGAIVTIDANDIIGLSIPAKSLPYTSSATGLLAALSVAEGALVLGGAADVTTIDAKGDGKILIGNGTTVTSQSVTGDITITNAGLVAIASGVIVNADVNASAAIDGSKIKPFFNTAVGLYGAATTVNTAGDAQFTPAAVLGLAIMRDCNGAPRADTLPDADDLIAAITGAYVGQSFYVTIVNTSGAANASTITGGVNCSMVPTSPPAVAQNKSITFLIVLTNVTPAAEAYSAYVVGALD